MTAGTVELSSFSPPFGLAGGEIYCRDTAASAQCLLDTVWLSGWVPECGKRNTHKSNVFLITKVLSGRW